MRLLLVAALTAAVAYHYFGPKPLDGTVWEVKVRHSALSWGRRDTLVFERGRLTVGDASPSRYSVQSSGDARLFTANLSRDGEAMSWSGVARAGKVEGTVLVIDASGKPRRLTFSGTLKSRS